MQLVEFEVADIHLDRILSAYKPWSILERHPRLPGPSQCCVLFSVLQQLCILRIIAALFLPSAAEAFTQWETQCLPHIYWRVLYEMPR